METTNGKVTKKFGVYFGLLLFSDCIGLGLILIVSSIIIKYADFSNIKILIASAFWIAFSFFVIYTAVRHFTYKLIVENGKIFEVGWFSKSRVINISDIRSVDRDVYWMMEQQAEGHYSAEANAQLWKLRWILLLMTMRGFSFSYMPLMSFKGNFKLEAPFPAYPMNPKVLDAIYDENPQIKIDQRLVDFLPSSLRKKMGVSMTVTDVIGLWLWRFFITLLILILLSPVIFVAYFKLF